MAVVGVAAPTRLASARPLALESPVLDWRTLSENGLLSVQSAVGVLDANPLGSIRSADWGPNLRQMSQKSSRMSSTSLPATVFEASDLQKQSAGPSIQAEGPAFKSWLVGKGNQVEVRLVGQVPDLPVLTRQSQQSTALPASLPMSVVQVAQTEGTISAQPKIPSTAQPSACAQLPTPATVVLGKAAATAAAILPPPVFYGHGYLPISGGRSLPVTGNFYSTGTCLQKAQGAPTATAVPPDVFYDAGFRTISGAGGLPVTGKLPSTGACVQEVQGTSTATTMPTVFYDAGFQMISGAGSLPVTSNLSSVGTFAQQAPPSATCMPLSGSATSTGRLIAAGSPLTAEKFTGMCGIQQEKMPLTVGGGVSWQAAAYPSGATEYSPERLASLSMAEDRSDRSGDPLQEDWRYATSGISILPSGDMLGAMVPSGEPPVIDDQLPLEVGCAWTEDSDVWIGLGAPAVRLEPHWRDNRWWIAAPVDFKGLERSELHWRDTIDLLDAEVQEADDQGKIPALPVPRAWEQVNSCPIS